MSDSSRCVRRAARTRRRRRAIILVCIGVGALLIIAGAATWLVARGAQAVRALETVLPTATRMEAAARAGRTATANADAVQLRRSADRAHQLTNDPIWRAAEYLPFLGRNLTALRDVSASTATIADASLDPLVALLGEETQGAFAPVDGKLSLQPLADMAPDVARANSAIQSANRLVSGIDSRSVAEPLRIPIKQYQSKLAQFSKLADSANRAVTLLPDMLGGSGPRTYLLLFLNSAELRASGGIPGSVAHVTVVDGKMTLDSQASGQSFGELESPILPLSSATKTLYGNITGTYMQDVTLTPEFPESAELAAAMWKRRYNQSVDGVVTLDPVALSYILRVTGPVTVEQAGSTSVQLTSANVVKTLLSDVYATIPDPHAQDAFFQKASAAIFARLASGTYDSSQMLSALAQIGNERRMNIWSSSSSEERVLKETTLAGALPTHTNASTYGIYLSDGTGAKMDYYLRTSVKVGSPVTCKGMGRADTLSVTLTNSAPDDAASSLPAYVTGNGYYGVAAGTIRTIITVYAPQGRTLAAVHRDGEDAAALTALDGKHTAAQFAIDLKPGQSSTVKIVFSAKKKINSSAAQVLVTPQVHAVDVSRFASSCASVLN